MTTKILALTDALGNLVRLVLLPGQRFDTVGVPPLTDGLAFGALIGDTAFDSNDIVADLNERGAKVVIAQHPRRTTALDIDSEMYKWRHRNCSTHPHDRKHLIHNSFLEHHAAVQRQSLARGSS